MSDAGNFANDSRVGPPPLPANYGKPLAPVSTGERIVSLDGLRGLALLGILIANMLHFSQPLVEDGMRDGLWFGPLDRVADWFSLLLIDGKFYPLFSFLFGLGFSIQMERASSRALDPKAVYVRRLFILMGIGLAHGIFLWNGDVLFAYALCGFALLLFRNRKPLTIMIWAAALVILPALLILLFGVLLTLIWGDPQIKSAFMESTADDLESRRELIRAFVTGGYFDAVSYRTREMFFTMFATLIFAPAFLGLFLVGMLAGRMRVITEVARNWKLLVKIFVVCGAVGLAGNFIGAWIMMAANAKEHWGFLLIGTAVISIFGPVLTAAYIAGIVMLIQRRAWFVMLSPIAAAGRMALTNYLAQSLIATTIFYGYGFGLGGTVGKLGTMGIALLIFAGQVLFSVVWLRHFRYGPLEWLWRSLTYGARQPMSREKLPELTPPP
jgi:uncharacterized protein